jgi:hypothetical protein
MINYDEYQKIKEDQEIKEKARKRFERAYHFNWEPVSDEQLNKLLLDYVMITREIALITDKNMNYNRKAMYQELLCHLGADTDNRIEAMTKAMEIIDPPKPVVQPTYTPRYIR